MLLLNPLIRKYLETAVRDGLKALGVFLVARGWVSEADFASALPGLTLFLVGILWSLWERRDSLRKINTALSLPEGTTQQQLAQTIKRDGPVPADIEANISPIAPAEMKKALAELRKK